MVPDPAFRRAGEPVAAPCNGAAMNRPLRFWLAAASVRLAGLMRVAPGDFANLWSDRHHAPAVERAREELIAHRVRLIAAVLVPSTLAWIAVDAFAMPWPYWMDVAWGRIAAAPVFLALALRPRRLCMIGGAGVEVALLMAVPVAFYLYTNVVLSVPSHHGDTALNANYAHLPLVLAAALAIFPLTLREALIPVGLVLVAAALSSVLWPEFLHNATATQELWQLFVIAFWASLAGLSQLLFLLRLTDQVTRDGLTNLLVRGTGEEILESQFAYAKRQDLPFAVLFIDIDRFKSINDDFGHDAGDAALRLVADHIARVFRHQDVMIRWGGEEFVVGLPGADIGAAEVAVLRLAQTGIGARPDYQPITASIGIAERKADGIDTLTALVECADARMYEAKRAGRNRYVIKHGPRPWLRATSHKAAAQ